MRGGLAIYGLIGGVNGSACMSVLRLAARRWGFIEQMPPQAMVDWSRSRLGGGRWFGRAHYHLADELVHLAVSATAGAAFGALMGSRRRSSLPAGALFGAGVWAVAFGAVAPALGLARPPWRARSTENAVNIGAHVLYGIVTALMTRDLAGQPRWASSDRQRRRMRVG
jgi:hypothetical protein